jgi:transporter family-2 protein
VNYTYGGHKLCFFRGQIPPRTSAKEDTPSNADWIVPWDDGAAAENQVSSQPKKDKHMENLLLIILIGLAGGIAVGLQSPLSSLMSQRIGTLESVFIVHIGGAIAALLPLLFYSGGKLSQWRTVPWYALVAGVFGLVVIGAVSYMIPRIGVAASITTIVAGQLLVGTILDHFGLLGAAERSLDLTRILGLGVVLVGVWLTVK